MTTPTPVTTVFAGSGSSGYVDGAGSVAKFSYPYDFETDSSGNLYVVDSLNCRIRRITPSGTVSTFAGGGCGWYSDGTGTNALFNTVAGITKDSSGNFYVSEMGGHRVRKITAAGVVSTFAGAPDFNSAPQPGYAEGTGTAARFSSPRGLAVDSGGNVYVVDSNNYRIRKITPGGVVTTLAGGVFGYADGTGTAAQFRLIADIVIDSSGNLYLTDSNRIRKITTGGVVTTFAGISTGGLTDGAGATAQFRGPYGITIDSKGNLYTADVYNNCIRKIAPDAQVSTYLTGFTNPRTVAIISNALYVATTETTNYIYKISLSCSGGYFLDGLSCTQCSAGQYSAAGASSCTSCSAGTYSAAGASSCTSCSAGTYSAAGASSCSSCSAGTYSAAGASSCTSCPAGKYSSTVGATSSATCTPCSAGTYSTATGATSSATCSTCLAGTYSAAGASSCTSCSAGTYSTATGATSSATCSTCPAGKYSSTVGATSASSCTSCPAGKYSSAVGATSASTCSTCLAGTYSAAGATSCSLCLAGKYSLAGASSCTSCSAGTYSSATGATSSSTCTSCSAGTYSSATGAATSGACTLCPTGTYSSTVGASSCSVCSAGTYSNVVGATSASTCNSCPVGQYSSAGAQYCSSCPAGQYLPTGSLSCTACPVGQYSLLGDLSCRLCPLGTYSNVTGATTSTTCTPCPVGQYSATEGSNVCSKCTAGTYSNVTSATSASTCTPCPMGQYSAAEGSNVCSKCTAGTYSNVTSATSCTSCPAGKYSAGGSIECSNTCPAAGYYYNSAACLTCPAGTSYIGPRINSSSNCTPCGSGTYAGLGFSSCLKCPPGTSFTGTRGVSSDVCVQCAAGKFSNVSGSALCSSCPTGTSSTLGSSFCYRATGGFIEETGLYYITHTFTSSGSFVPLSVSGLTVIDFISVTPTQIYLSPDIFTVTTTTPITISSTSTPTMSGKSPILNPGTTIVTDYGTFNTGSTQLTIVYLKDPCTSGTFWNPLKKQCVASCTVPFTTAQNGVCVKCTSRSLALSTPLVCETGFTLSGTTCTGNENKCPDSSWTLSGTTCTKTDVNCPSETNSTIRGYCISTTDGSSSLPVSTTLSQAATPTQVTKPAYGSVCVSSCPVNTYMNIGDCVQCPGGQLSAAGSTSINACQCPIGTFGKNGSGLCTSCGTNQTSPQGTQTQTGCVMYCSVGSYASGTSCTPCPYGTSPAGSTSVSACSCAYGTFLNASSCVAQCPSGMYGDTSTNTCISCPGNQTSAAGSVGANRCVCPDETGGLNGSGICSPCTGGQNSTLSTSTCPDTTWTLMGSVCSKVSSYDCPNGTDYKTENTCYYTTFTYPLSGCILSSYTCPSDRTVNGSVCLKTGQPITAATVTVSCPVPTSYVCPSGYTLSGTTCTSNTPLYYSCPNGGSSTSTDNSNNTTAISGYVLEGNRCKRYRCYSNTPSGTYISIKGSVCKYYDQTYSCPAGYIKGVYGGSQATMFAGIPGCNAFQGVDDTKYNVTLETFANPYDPTRPKKYFLATSKTNNFCTTRGSDNSDPFWVTGGASNQFTTKDVSRDPAPVKMSTNTYYTPPYTPLMSIYYNPLMPYTKTFDSWSTGYDTVAKQTTYVKETYSFTTTLTYGYSVLDTYNKCRGCDPYIRNYVNPAITTPPGYNTTLCSSSTPCLRHLSTGGTACEALALSHDPYYDRFSATLTSSLRATPYTLDVSTTVYDDVAATPVRDVIQASHPMLNSVVTGTLTRSDAQVISIQTTPATASSVQSRQCSCSAGKFWDFVTKQCKTQCPVATYADSATNTCKPCPANKTSIAGSTNISQCVCSYASPYWAGVSCMQQINPSSPITIYDRNDDYFTTSGLKTTYIDKYVIHEFTTAGKMMGFYAQRSIVANILIVGGGAGGTDTGKPGGGGEVVSLSNQNLNASEGLYLAYSGLGGSANQNGSDSILYKGGGASIVRRATGGVSMTTITSPSQFKFINLTAAILYCPI